MTRLALTALIVASLTGATFSLPTHAGKDDRKQVETGDGGELKNPFGGLFGDEEDDGDSEGGKVIEAYKPSGFDYSGIAVDRPKSLGIFRSMSYGLVPEATVQAYLNGVLARILAVSPEPNIPAQVYLRADSAFDAAATPDGGIFVSLGLLKSLANEDELAFVLSHELAHIIYRHHDSDWYFDTQRRGLASASLAHDVATQAQQKLGSSVGTNAGTTELEEVQFGLMVGDIAYETGDVLIHSAWTREQEEEADRLGLDLMIAAGYNMIAATSMLATLDAWEKQHAPKKRTAEEREEAISEAAEDSSLGGLFSQMFEEATTVFNEQKEELDRDHPPAAERSLSVQDYMLSEYIKAVPPPISEFPWRRNDPSAAPISALLASYDAARGALKALRKGETREAEGLARQSIIETTKHDALPRYAFYSVRKSQGKPDLAQKNLELAMRGSEPSFVIYKTLIDNAKAKRDWDAAVQQVEAARKSLADPPILLPDRIELYPKVGRGSEVRALVIECSTDYPELTPLCLAAAERS